MNFLEAATSCFKKYATFEGRASRSEYWFWFLFQFAVSVILEILDVGVLHVDIHDPHAFYPLSMIFGLAILLPSLAVAVRRLHDVDRSGWWLLIVFTIIGIFYPLLVWNCTKGTEGNNRFGSDQLA